MSSKFAGIIGPFVFGLVGQLTGSSRLSVVALVIFFIGGGLILLTVDEKQGRARASKSLTFLRLGFFCLSKKST